MDHDNDRVTSDARQPVSGTCSRDDWSRVYWGVLLSQIVVVTVLAPLAGGMIHESYRASEAAELMVPTMTQWYFALRPAGLLLVGLATVFLAAAAAVIRRRLAAVLIAVSSLLISVLILAGAMLAATFPLLVAIRDMLPPAERW